MWPCEPLVGPLWGLVGFQSCPLWGVGCGAEVANVVNRPEHKPGLTPVLSRFRPARSPRTLWTSPDPPSSCACDPPSSCGHGFHLLVRVSCARVVPHTRARACVRACVGAPARPRPPPGVPGCLIDTPFSLFFPFSQPFQPLDPTTLGSTQNEPFSCIKSKRSIQSEGRQLSSDIEVILCTILYSYTVAWSLRLF